MNARLWVGAGAWVWAGGGDELGSCGMQLGVLLLWGWWVCIGQRPLGVGRA